MIPKTAMVLAAGKGTRLQPITHHTPKPLVEIAGRSLLDRGLDRLAEAGVERCIINVHHLGEQIIDYAKTRHDMALIISDERDQLTDSAGAFVKARALLGDDPIFFLNADTFWLEPEGVVPALVQMAAQFAKGDARMLLMLARLADATGHSGGLDFAMDAAGHLSRAQHMPDQPGYIYAGAGILDMHLFDNAPLTPHSLNQYFDQTITTHSLFGHVLEGHWITVGTPDALAAANQWVLTL